MERRYCTQCGHELNKDDAFCSKCGTPVPKPTAVLEADAAGSRRRWLNLLFAFIALLIIGGSGFAIWASMQEDKDPSEMAAETSAVETVSQKESLTTVSTSLPKETTTVAEETTQVESTTVAENTSAETSTEAESTTEAESASETEEPTNQEDQEITEPAEDAITTAAPEDPVYEFVGDWEVVITVPAEGVNWDLVEKVMGSEIPAENRTGIVQSFTTKLEVGTEGLVMTYAPDAAIEVDGNKLYMTIPDQAFVYIVDAQMMEDQVAIEGSVDVMMLGQKYASGRVEIQRNN